MNNAQQPVITPREALDFKLDDSIPRHWFDNDPFKSRFIDAISTTFPEGERYFIASVRPFRDRITDPELLKQVKDFTRQEGQHTMIHLTFNDLLARQGMPVHAVYAHQRKILGLLLRRCSPELNLAVTAACEHITALMADAFFSTKNTLNGANERVRAMLAWHAIEEMEHKAVAFDVMQNVAKVSYWRRISIMALFLPIFIYFGLLDTNAFLRADGFSWRQRFRLMMRGIAWAYGPKGVMTAMLKPWLAYFRRSFHPWQTPAIDQYTAWESAYTSSGDPIAAGEALYAAAR